jgi:hypothetical protein
MAVEWDLKRAWTWHIIKIPSILKFWANGGVFFASDWKFKRGECEVWQFMGVMCKWVAVEASYA